MSKIYVAGPMRGIPFFNFPAFDAARDRLKKFGWEVISPADLDRAIGFDEKSFPADYDWVDLNKIGFDINSAVDRDVAAIKSCDAIYMLKGWDDSKGASAEKGLAEWLGKPVLYEGEMAGDPWTNKVTLPDGNITRQAMREMSDRFTWVTKAQGGPAIPEPQGPNGEGSTVVNEKDVLLEAYEITRGDRNAAYGPPDQDFTRTAAMLTGMFAHKLKDNEKFLSWEIAQLMICLKLSRLQHNHKRDSIVDIAGYARCMDICYRSAGARAGDA